MKEEDEKGEEAMNKTIKTRIPAAPITKYRTLRLKSIGDLKR